MKKRNITCLISAATLGVLLLPPVGVNAGNDSREVLDYSSIPADVPPLPEECIIDTFETVENYISYFLTYDATSKGLSRNPLLRSNPPIPPVVPASGSDTNYVYNPQVFWVLLADFDGYNSSW